MLNVNESKVYEIYKNRLFDLSGKNRLLSFRLNAKSLDMYSIGGFDINDVLHGSNIKITMAAYVDSRVEKEKEHFDKEYAEYEKEKEKYEFAKKKYEGLVDAYLERAIKYENDKQEFERVFVNYLERKIKYKNDKQKYEQVFANYLEKKIKYENDKQEFEQVFANYLERKIKYENDKQEFEKKFQEFELRKQNYIKENKEFDEVFEEVFEDWIEVEPVFNDVTPIEPIFNDVIPIEPVFNAVKPIEPVFNKTEPKEPIFDRDGYIAIYEKEFRSLIKKIDKIDTDTQNYNKETGNKSLYLCYYFLSGKLKGDNVVKIYAPLFLIPVELHFGNNSFQFELSNEEIFVNRTLLIAMMKVLGKTINLNTFEYNKLTEKDIINFINKLEELDIDIEKKVDQVKFPNNVISSITDKFVLHNHLILSNLVVANSIYDDYEKLGNDTNESVRNLISNDYIRDVDIEKVKQNYFGLNLTNREISMITKLDTSQELAVYMTKKANNLVIYGPPGTGKSETILNIISDSIANNKKILVVSEKKTAIDVLYNRLGLLQKLSLIFDTSSLRLNDLKVQINNNLNNSIQIKFNKPFETVLSEMEDCYKYFDKVYNILNKEYNGRKISEWYGERKEEVKLSINDEERLKLQILKNKVIKELFNKDYESFKQVIVLMQDKEKIRIFNRFNKDADKFNTFINLLSSDLDIQSFIYELLYITEKPDVFNTYFDRYLSARSMGIVKVLESKKYENIDFRTAELDVLNYKIKELTKEKLNKSYYVNTLTKLLSCLSEVNPKTYVNGLRAYFKSFEGKVSPNIQHLFSCYIFTFDEYVKVKNSIFHKKSRLSDLEDKCNERKASLNRELILLISNTQNKLDSDEAELDKLIVEKQAIENNNNRLTFEKNQLMSEIESLKNEAESCGNSIVSEIGHLPIFWSIVSKKVPFKTAEEAENLLQLLREFKDNKDKLLDLIEDDTIVVSLFTFLNENNMLDIDDSIKLFWKFYVEKQINSIEKENDKNLREVKKYENYQHIFSDSERYCLNKAVEDIYKNRVMQRNNNYSLPDEYLKAEKRFLSEKDSKSKRFTVRQFVEAFYDVIINYFPVILATPNAASKFMSLKKDSFDVVVYDEASQLLIENAIPTIYRAKKVIVVGDDKQLKPSKFFSSSMDIDEELGLVTDEEISDIDLLFIPDSISQLSLLDNAKNKYNSVSLLYHYRSRYSELIDFSNAVFYKGQLKLAPNVFRNSVSAAIQRIKVDGKWLGNQNVVEAEKVVELLKEIFNTRKENETIGIITFNKKQQECIENRILEECLANTQFNTIYRKEQNRIEHFEDKSIFIKNIENVQGDERDIIIFSIGYGLNERGKLIIQFGPLSQDGGENRLNVAISRAKKQIYVVTSFEPEELNVENTKNNGPKYFKEYLEYTKYVSAHDISMVKALLSAYNAHNNIIETKSFDSPFEEQIYKSLIDRGYIVDTQIGCFGFKIDMGIYDEKSGRYLLGIECDGATYHSSTRAKDRDIARQAFLESCGWKIFRIWSSVWWKDNISILEKLDAVVAEEKEKIKEIEAVEVEVVDNREWESNDNTVDIFRYIIEKEDEKKKFNTLEFFNTALFNKRLKKDYELLQVIDSLESYHNIEDIPIYFEADERDVSIIDAYGYASYNVQEGPYTVLSLDDLSIKPKIDIIKTILHEYFHTLSTVNCYERYYIYSTNFENKALSKLISQLSLNGEDTVSKKIKHTLSELSNDSLKYWKEVVQGEYDSLYEWLREGITELLAQFYTFNLYKDNMEKQNNFYFVNDNFEENEYWKELIRKYDSSNMLYPWSSENIEFYPSYGYNVSVVLTIGLYADLRKIVKFYLESDFLSLHLYLFDCVPNWGKVFDYLRHCETDLKQEDFNKILSIEIDD